MVAVSRFVQFSVTGETFVTGNSSTTNAEGTRAYMRGNGLAGAADSFIIVANSNNQLGITLNGVGPNTITLASGTSLDPRFVARDIEYKIHSHSAASSSTAWKFAQCDWRNGGASSNIGNAFILYSGLLGANGGANTVNVTAGGFDARATLGFNTTDSAAGTDTTVNASYTGAAVVSGSYSGQFDDFYTVFISDGENVRNATSFVGSYITNGGSITTGGIYLDSADNDYLVTIDTTNGSVMGGGTGNVPQMDFTDTPGTEDGSAGPVELLYVNHWYDLGTKGARVKFSDAVFGSGDSFHVLVSGTTAGGGSVGTAKYIFTSSQEDSSKAHSIAPTTTLTTGTQVGTRGVTIAFSNSGTLTARDRFSIICRGPQPTDSNVTQLNFGNVTVSTQSSVKVVWFEIISGAVSMSTVKFSLQSDGTFQHHDQGNNDTEFHFGTCGAGNDAAGSGPTSNSQAEFPVDGNGLGRILATDIDQDSTVAYLNATKSDLAEVTSADLAQTIGNYSGALVSDFIWLAIKLGASETGANSTINYRMYFDFQ